MSSSCVPTLQSQHFVKPALVAAESGEPVGDRVRIKPRARPEMLVFGLEQRGHDVAPGGLQRGISPAELDRQTIEFTREQQLDPEQVPKRLWGREVVAPRRSSRGEYRANSAGGNSR